MTRIKKISIILSIAIFSIGIYLYMCMVLAPKDMNDYGGKMFYQGKGFVAEEKNSLDVVFYGNSDVYSGIIPSYIYKKYNIKSYASGAANQPIGQVKRLIKKTLITQRPRVMVLDVDCLYTDKIVKNGFLSLLTAPLEHHARWKTIKLRDFFTLPSLKKQKDVLKGYYFSLKVQPFNPGNYMENKDEVKPISKRSMKHLNQIVEMSKKAGINLILMSLPSPISWNYGKHAFVKGYAEKHNLKFLDMNIPSEGFKIDYSKDFRDKGDHLNIFGAVKASKYIGSYIKSNYTISPTFTEVVRTDWKKSDSEFTKLLLGENVIIS